MHNTVGFIGDRLDLVLRKGCSLVLSDISLFEEDPDGLQVPLGDKTIVAAISGVDQQTVNFEVQVSGDTFALSLSQDDTELLRETHNPQKQKPLDWVCRMFDGQDYVPLLYGRVIVHAGYPS
jgi:hypothetical protein